MATLHPKRILLDSIMSHKVRQKRFASKKVLCPSLVCTPGLCLTSVNQNTKISQILHFLISSILVCLYPQKSINKEEMT